MKKPETKFRYFCFTDYKATEEKRTWWRDFSENERCVYLVYGNEICPTTGKEHLQGFISFKNPRHLSALIKKTGDADIEVCRDPDSAINYCKKGRTFFEYGEWIRKGPKLDVDKMREMVMGGATVAEIVNAGFSYQTFRMVEIGIRPYHLKPKRNWKTEVRWYWGPTGTGKSETAFEEIQADGREYWTKGEILDGILFPNYVDEELVLLDDFRPEQYKFSSLLQLLNRYSYHVKTLGGDVEFVAKCIWITTLMHPANFYGINDDMNQLLRRIDIIKEFGTATQVESVIDPPVIFTKIPNDNDF